MRHKKPNCTDFVYAIMDNYAPKFIVHTVLIKKILRKFLFSFKMYAFNIHVLLWYQNGITSVSANPLVLWSFVYTKHHNYLGHTQFCMFQMLPHACNGETCCKAPHTYEVVWVRIWFGFIEVSHNTNCLTIPAYTL